MGVHFVKILYLTHQYFPRHVGGTEMYVRGVATRARSRGHELRIVTAVESPSGDPDAFGPREIEVDGIPVTELHYNLSVAPDPARFEFDNAFLGDAIRREIASFGPDVVHAVHTMKLSGSALDACHAAGAPVVATLCDFWYICPRHTLLKWDGSLCRGPEHDLYCAPCLKATHGFSTDQDAPAIRARNPYLRDALLRCSRIIALCGFQKQRFVEHGYPPGRIEVIPHGLDTTGLMTRARRAARPVRVAFIGSLARHKGPHVLVEAVLRAPELDIECLIHGAADGKDEYTQSLKVLASGDPRIHFRGAFPPERTATVLDEADLLAVPALWFENEPLVMKAALHIGLPILASNLGSLPVMLRGYQTGWLAPAGDVPAWTSALRDAVPRVGTLDPAPVPMKSMDQHAEEMLGLLMEVRHGHDTNDTPDRSPRHG
ncbi:MAG: glycosyltransferase [bacterium]